VTHAAVIVVLAATLPTGTFLAVQLPVGLSFLGLGLGGVIWRKQYRPAAQPAEYHQDGS
jgi:hypothetical protein